MRKSTDMFGAGRDVIRNMGWLFFDKFLRMGGGFFIGIVIARYLGPEQFGKLSYALAFVGIFTALASLGLDSVLIREIINKEQLKYRLLGTAFMLKLAASVTCFLFAIFFSFVAANEGMVKVMVAIISAGIVFQSLDVMRLWFESRLESKFVVIAQDSAFIAVALLKIFLVYTRASLIFFALAVSIEIAVGMLWLVFFYRFKGQLIREWRFELDIAKGLLKACWPLILSSLAIIIYMRISVIMLGIISGARQVGIYSVALSISEVWYFVPMIVLTSLYPKLVQLYNRDEKSYTQRLIHVMSLFFWASVIISALVILFSRDIIRVLYGSQYSAAYSVLSLLIFSGTVVSPSVIFSQRYILKNQQKVSLYGTLSGGISCVLLNLVLIPKYSFLGAAIATLVSYFVPLLFISTFFDRSVGEIFLRAVFHKAGSRQTV